MPEITPLGFKKPLAATELVRWGAGVIADNAQLDQELHAAALARIQTVESAAFGSGAVPLIEDPDDPGFYILSS